MRQESRDQVVDVWVTALLHNRAASQALDKVTIRQDCASKRLSPFESFEVVPIPIDLGEDVFSEDDPGRPLERGATNQKNESLVQSSGPLRLLLYLLLCGLGSLGRR